MKHNTHTERPLGGIVDIIPPPFRRRGLRVAATLLLRALLNLVGYEEVLIKEAEGIIHGYLPEIDGIIYED